MKKTGLGEVLREYEELMEELMKFAKQGTRAALRMEAVDQGRTRKSPFPLFQMVLQVVSRHPEFR